MIILYFNIKKINTYKNIYSFSINKLELVNFNY